MSQERHEYIAIENGRNSGCFKYFVVAILCIVLTPVFCIGALSFATQSTFEQIISRVTGLFEGEPDVATVHSTRTLVSSIQPLGQLVSISAEVAKADIGVFVETGGLNLCGHSAQHVAQGVIEAGVDLTGISENNVSYNESLNKYSITLPSPQITSCRIEYIRQYGTSSNVGCGIDWDRVRLLAQYVATIEFAEDSIDEGILDRAKRETSILMQSFVGALTQSEVEIIYQASPETVIFPDSCQPQIPRGWVFDAETDKWNESS